MRRLAISIAVSVMITLLVAGPALACGGLIAPNGSVNLVRTTTLSAYVDGVEHYVTSFEFSGADRGKFGSIVPLPDVPTKVTKAGRWTLQRLVQEVTPVAESDVRALAAPAADEAREAEVLLETRVSALDITVLKGGGDEVGLWAKQNGFSLPPDAPEVLDFYAERSPIFMAVRFNLKRAAAKDLGVGDGIPVHVTIPTDQPWVPLRILALGADPDQTIEADVFTLTEDSPAILPYPGFPFGKGLSLDVSGPASETLMADLRSDRGMKWLPEDMWLNYIRIDTPARNLRHDLALNVSGGAPSPVDAGLSVPGSSLPPLAESQAVLPWALAAVVAVGALAISGRVAGRRA